MSLRIDGHFPDAELLQRLGRWKVAMLLAVLSTGLVYHTALEALGILGIGDVQVAHPWAVDKQLTKGKSPFIGFLY